MTESTGHDAIAEQDWGDAWEDLPPAPPLVAGPKTAQITLRVPSELIAALKTVAASKSLPYHALARSWILEGLRAGRVPEVSAEVEEDTVPRSSEQLNLKVEPEVLDDLKRFSHETRRPYHQLARQWVEVGVVREHPITSSRPRPSLRELMMLLLDGDLQRGSAIRGMTRLQKLLYVIQDHLDRESSTFYAWKYGPFDEKVIDSAEALRVQGFLASAASASSSKPSFEQMMATVAERAGPKLERESEVFELSPAGREAAKRLRRSNRAYANLHARVQELRQQWDTGDLLERVYQQYPGMTGKSVIKDEVDRRRERRRG